LAKSGVANWKDYFACCLLPVAHRRQPQTLPAIAKNRISNELATWIEPRGKSLMHLDAENESLAPENVAYCIYEKSNIQI